MLIFVECKGSAKYVGVSAVFGCKSLAEQPFPSERMLTGEPRVLWAVSRQT